LNLVWKNLTAMHELTLIWVNYV